MSTATEAPSGTRQALRLGLALAALGVVYGDIGTSPLYALRESFHVAHLPTTPENVLGVLSLIFWSLVLVVSVKYVAFVLRADNDGEGGILALASLLVPLRARLVRRRLLFVALGLLGAALLYGDSVITPAISVLSAVEGLKQIAPTTEPFVIPLTLVILVGLFAFQYRGTAGIGKIFGPVMLLWFGTLAALGVRMILQYPGVFEAINPYHGYYLFVHNGFLGFTVLGAVVLAVTGGEALYADLGHFGLRPIRQAWLAVALPALLLNYFGQGALLLTDPEGFEHPFFHLAPAWFLPFLVVLATLATVIASQAVISGAFSLTMHLVQFGYIPRLKIVNTSNEHAGQIYVPFVNWALLAACILLVLAFRSSSALAAAYGIAVTSTMAITTFLFAVFARRRWGWPGWAVAAFLLVFLPIDLAFLGANLLKVVHGGWVPLALALGLFGLMLTWKRGRETVTDVQYEGRLPIEMLLEDLARRDVERVPGVAVFFNARSHVTPSALLHNLKHNHVLHERNLLLNVRTVSRPHVPEAERAELVELGQGFYRAELSYGFAETPCVADDVAKLTPGGTPARPMETSFFLRRERLVVTPRKGMSRWRKHLLAVMTHAAADAADYYGLPPGRVIELGERVAV